MIELSRTITLDMGHRALGHKGACHAGHGHTFRLEIFATGNFQDSGMIVDFSYLKELLQEVHSIFDHSFVIWKEDKELIDLHFKDWEDFSQLTSPQSYMLFPSVRPFGKVVVSQTQTTVEYLTMLWFSIMMHKLVLDRVDKNSNYGSLEELKLTRLKVWETPNSCCEYSL